MGKHWWIQIFVIPNLMAASAYLRSQDENHTGLDDEAANGIDYLVKRLQEYVSGSVRKRVKAKAKTRKR